MHKGAVEMIECSNLQHSEVEYSVVHSTVKFSIVCTVLCGTVYYSVQCSIVCSVQCFVWHSVLSCSGVQLRLSQPQWCSDEL